MERIEKAGARVVYRQVDVRQADEIRAVLAEIRRDIGPIRGLVHGAGIVADQLIEDKTAEQFEAVYATKVSSLQTLLEALKDDDLRLLALFSSSTARFGRAGQVDYAIANEVLNKLAQSEACHRPGCKVVSLNWGPWDGGMVNAGLKKLFAQEGVGLIGLQEGAEFFIQEICQPIGGSIEVVVLGSIPGDQSSADVPGSEKSLACASGSDKAVENVVFARELTVESMPVLRSHVIKGHPVLPMALIVEWLAHGAIHANPGLLFHGFNDLAILKGVILTDDRPAHLRVLTGKAIKEDGLYRVPVELRGAALGPSASVRDIPHARAEIVLAASLPALDETAPELALQPYLRSQPEIYGNLLFHGKDLHGIVDVEGCSEEGIIATVSSAPPPASWIKQPLRGAWLADPLVLDSSFQLMILWSFEQFGAGSLPCAAGRYRQFCRSFQAEAEGEAVRVIAKVTHRSQNRALANLDFVDGAGKLLARMTDYECVIDTSLNQAFRGNQLVAGS